MSEALTAALIDDGGIPLKQKLKRAERRHKLKSMALVAPLFLFLLLSFVFPIGTLLYRSVDNPELPQTLPQTTAALADWSGKALPDETVFAALVADLKRAQESGKLGLASKRLNYEITGYRSLLNKTVRKLPSAPPYREALIALDPAWGDLQYWTAMSRASASVTSFYLLAAIDHKVDAQGSIVRADEQNALYVDVFLRTFWMGLVVTLLCLALGYPVAYVLANLPAHISNLLLILVLLPFWTSLLVRTAAWIVLLQSGGLINNLLMQLHLISAPLELVFNRIGVYVSMTHILLPFMILPLYSVMKGIPPHYLRAALSLGAKPSVAFWRVYLPQTFAGVGAGALLVFILAIGYYITPALVGGPGDQMVSYYVAFFTNRTINWGMAAALGSLLLLATLLLYGLYGKLAAAQQGNGR